MKPVDQTLETSFNGVYAVHGVPTFLSVLIMGYDNLKKLKVKNFLQSVTSFILSFTLFQIRQLKTYCIFLKFDHPIHENDTSPFFKGGDLLISI
jgi:hypothetical protein